MTEGPLRTVSCLVVAALAMTLGGCGGVSMLAGHRASASARPAGQDGPAADPAKVAVIRTWARELQRGDVRAAAKLFRLPSEFSDGEPLRIQTLEQAEIANATLTCGATFISAFRQGRYINVLFRLTDRTGEGGGPNSCGSGVGDSARTDFLIEGGQIVQWLRAASRPGDPGAPTTSTPTPAAPGPSTGTI